jgi:hypothetical protein
MERATVPFTVYNERDPDGLVSYARSLERENERLRLWVRRIENINDDPSCFNVEIDRACRAAWHGLPMNGKINVDLPAAPEKE